MMTLKNSVLDTQRIKAMFQQSKVYLLQRPLSINEQTFFAKRLSFLLRSGIPLVESLILIKEQTKQKTHVQSLEEIIERLSNGQSFFQSLHRSKAFLGEYAMTIIDVGESAGLLSDNMEYLSQELKKRRQLTRKVVGAFVYPAVVSFATIGITAFLVLYLFPKIVPVFLSLHMKLPMTTRVVMSVSNFLIHYGLWVLVIVVILTTFLSFLIVIPIRMV